MTSVERIILQVWKDQSLYGCCSVQLWNCQSNQSTFEKLFHALVSYLSRMRLWFAANRAIISACFFGGIMIAFGNVSNSGRHGWK